MGLFLFLNVMEMIDKQYEVDILKKLDALASEVGNTPLYLFNKVSKNEKVRIYGKQEWLQIGGSVKARAAYRIIQHAISRGELKNDKVLLDATSGNTGIGYAAIAQRLGIPVTLCLPENASQERKDILASLGVNIIPTSKFEGTDGAQQVAKKLFRENPGLYFYADQYGNPNNWKAHYNKGTADEIMNEVPEMTHFVSALGSTGTLVGTGRRLKELNPEIVVVSLQPNTPMHGLEGWKHLETAIVPQIYDPTVADLSLEVDSDEVYEMIKKVYRDENMLLSPSSAGNLVGAAALSEKIEQGIIVTMLPDNADKYSEIIKKII